MKRSMLFLSMISIVGFISCGEPSVEAQESFVLSYEQLEDYRYQVLADNCSLSQKKLNKQLAKKLVSLVDGKVNPSDIRPLEESKKIAEQKKCDLCVLLAREIGQVEEFRKRSEQVTRDAAVLLVGKTIEHMLVKELQETEQQSELKEILAEDQQAKIDDAELLAQVTQ